MMTVADFLLQFWNISNFSNQRSLLAQNYVKNNKFPGYLSHSVPDKLMFEQNHS